MNAFTQRWVGAAIAAWLQCFSLYASAQDAPIRGAVLRFEGRGALPAAAQRIVEREATAQLELVDGREVAARANALGVSLGTESGRARVAEDLRLDLLIAGGVRGSGRSLKTSIVVYDVSGAVAATRELSGGPSGRGKDQLRDLALSAVSDAVTQVRRHRTEQSAVLERQQLALIEQEVQRDAAPPLLLEEGESVPNGDVVFRATAGLAFRVRNADIKLKSNETVYYESGLYPEVAVHLEYNPFAGSDGYQRGLFARADFGYSFLLTSQEAQSNKDVDTTSMRFEAAVGWAYLFGDLFEAGLSVGFGLDSFDIAKNTVMPSRMYQYVRVGPRLRFHIVGDNLMIEADAAYRGVVGLGDVGDYFNKTASAQGVDATLSLLGALDFGFSYGVSLTYSNQFLSFSGAETRAGSGAKDGTDMAVIGTLVAGWVLR